MPWYLWIYLIIAGLFALILPFQIGQSWAQGHRKRLIWETPIALLRLAIWPIDIILALVIFGHRKAKEDQENAKLRQELLEKIKALRES